MLGQVHSSARVFLAQDHVLEDGAVPNAYLSLPSLFPDNTDKDKNNGGKLKKTSRSKENHGDIVVTTFQGYLSKCTYNTDS